MTTVLNLQGVSNSQCSNCFLTKKLSIEKKEVSLPLIYFCDILFLGVLLSDDLKHISPIHLRGKDVNSILSSTSKVSATGRTAEATVSSRYTVCWNRDLASSAR